MCLAIVLAALTQGVLMEEKSFVFDFTKETSNRINVDLPLQADLSKADAVSWEMKTDGLDGVMSLAMFFKSGPGWYSFGRLPELETDWDRLTVPCRDFSQQMNPSGLDKIDGFRIYVEIYPHARRRPITVTLRGLGTAALPPTAKARTFEQDNPAALAYMKKCRGKAGERRLAWCHSAFGMGQGKTWDETAAYVRRNGFTDLIVNLSWSGLAYYDSKVLPVYSERSSRGDQLKLALAACRKQGLKLHAWHVCYQFPEWTKDPAVQALKDKVVAENRSFQIEHEGRMTTWMCPSDRRNQRHIARAMVELAELGVDGIHFDYIRHRDSQNCCCPNCQTRFREKYGEDRSRWEDFRQSHIDTVVRAVARKVREEHPEIEISAAVQAHWWAMAQNWPRWCNEGWVDFVCPMDYTHVDYLFRTQIRSQRGELKSGCKAKIYPGIGLTSSFNWPQDGRDAERLAKKIEIVREEGFEGFTVFNLVPRFTRLMPLMRESILRP